MKISLAKYPGPSGEPTGYASDPLGGSFDRNPDETSYELRAALRIRRSMAGGRGRHYRPCLLRRWGRRQALYGRAGTHNAIRPSNAT
jgi:hypothetical protein